MNRVLKSVSHLPKWVTPKTMGHTWKNEGQLEKWVTHRKKWVTLGKKESHFEKWVTLWAMGHTFMGYT